MITGGLHWVFDPSPPSGARQGGLATAHVIEPELDKFVREVLQNARDQHIDDELVRVHFALHRLDGEYRDRFLDSMGWDELEPHLEGAASEGGITIGPQLEQALRDTRDHPLLVLRVDDSGTRGLTGGEDEPGGNFNALTRNTLVTSEDGRLRGGSFGLGKSVLWRFSSLSTVLFSSRVQDKPRWRFRLFGRSELPFHQTNGSVSWAGPGWFGREEELGSGQRRAISGWDEQVEEPARKIYLDRPAQLGTGTSIVVVGFFEPLLENPRELEETALGLMESTTRWFWPSLDPARPALQVDVRVYDNDSELYSATAGIGSEVEPFQEARIHHDLVETVSTPGEVAKRTLPFRIPARATGGGEVEAALTLRLRLAGTVDSPPLQNHVALVRGSGMVVRYRPVRIPLGDHSYHAVLYAGLARGTTDADIAMEEFLRASEPPSHNDWTPGTDRLRHEYRRGAQARLNGLWRELERSIADICEDRPSHTEQGPAKLAELFPVSGQGGGAQGRRGQFRVDRLDARFEDDTWRLSGRVRRLTDTVLPWSFNVVAWLDAETGPGEAVPVSELGVSHGEVRRSGNGWQCDIPPDAGEVMFAGVTDRLDAASVDLRRVRLRLQVHARSRQEQSES